MSKRRRHADDLRGATKLVIAATLGITDVVEEMHRTIAGGPGVLGRPLERPARAWTKLAYAPMRGITGLVGGGLDRALAKLGPLLGASVPGIERDAVLSALNGVLGDYLAETDNPLALTMELRLDERSDDPGAGEGRRRSLPSDPTALAETLRAMGVTAGVAPAKVLVLVHGSSMNDWQWLRGGHDHGAALARDLGYVPIYARYNSGLHISTNGRALAEALETLVAAWPVPVERLSLLGHSMGGLVSRSACDIAREKGHAWLGALRDLVCLGSPHHGSPLERGGNGIDVLLGVSAYSAPLARLGKIRSAGVTDLRYGSVADEDWQGRERFAWGRDARRVVPLPSGVACFAIAGTSASALGDALPGDGLVPVDSALGRHATAASALGFLPERQWVALGTRHLDLLSSQAVYEKLEAWLGG